MFAVITGPCFWKEIEQVVTSMGEEILFQEIDNNIDLSKELEKISRIAVKNLIIDISSIADQNRLCQDIMNYKIKREGARIIIIAPNCLPGNPMLSHLFSLGIWDFVVPDIDAEAKSNLQQILTEYLESPPSYQRGVRWFNDVQVYPDNAKNINLFSKDNVKDKNVNEKESITKIVKVIEIKTKEINITFEKQVFCIWGNSDFGCEFAYKMAELSNKKVAVVDLNLIEPTSWIQLKTSPGPEVQKSEFFSTAKASLELLIEMIRSDNLTYESIKECAVKRSDLKNLFLYTTEMSLLNRKDDYNFLVNELKNIIDVFYRTFDVTILLCNKAINDPFTLISLENANKVIVPFVANIYEASNYDNYKELLKNNNLINWNNVFYISFNYDPEVHISEDIDIKSEHGLNLGKQYLGHISQSRKRDKIQRTKRLYARRMEEEIEKEYIKVLKNFDIPLISKKYYKRNSGILRKIYKILQKKERRKIG